MKAAPLLRLPVLHPDTLLPSTAQAAIPGPHLWPGLPHMPDGFWSPESYPFAPEQAAACLGDMRAASEAALAGASLQTLAARDLGSGSTRDAEEIRTVVNFSRTGAADGADGRVALERARSAAHKVLLWAWLLEERVRELRELARRYGDGKARLSEAIGLEREDFLPGLSDLDTPLHDEQDILPPWRPVLESAAPFLPPDVTLLCNSPVMQTDLEDSLNFAPLPPDEASRLGIPENIRSPRQTSAPLRRLLGRDRPNPAAPWLNMIVRILLPSDSQDRDHA